MSDHDKLDVMLDDLIERGLVEVLPDGRVGLTEAGHARARELAKDEPVQADPDSRLWR